MKTLKLISLTLLFLFILVSCTFIDNDVSPQEDEEFFYTKNFDGLEIGNAFKVNVTKSRNFSIKARGNSNDINDLVLQVNKGILKIYYKNNFMKHRYRMNLDIEMPVLNIANFSGASDVWISDFDNTATTKISLSGASTGNFSMASKYYDIDLSGASNLRLSGDTYSMNINLSGASDINTYNTTASEITIDASGASTAKVNVFDNLFVKASGASDIRYRGNPTIKKSLSGNSTLKKD